MSRADVVDDDEPTNAAKTGGVSLKRVDMLKLLDCWGVTETIIKDVSKSLVMPKILPLRAFFKTVQEKALDIVDCSWDHIRAHYSAKFQVARRRPRQISALYSSGIGWVVVGI